MTFSEVPVGYPHTCWNLLLFHSVETEWVFFFHKCVRATNQNLLSDKIPHAKWNLIRVKNSGVSWHELQPLLTVRVPQVKTLDSLKGIVYFPQLFFCILKGLILRVWGWNDLPGAFISSPRHSKLTVGGNSCLYLYDGPVNGNGEDGWMDG